MTATRFPEPNLTTRSEPGPDDGDKGAGGTSQAFQMNFVALQKSARPIDQVLSEVATLTLGGMSSRKP